MFVMKISNEPEKLVYYILQFTFYFLLPACKYMDYVSLKKSLPSDVERDETRDASRGRKNRDKKG